MSWHFLDGPSRRQQRAGWVVPEHLRDSPQHGSGPFRRPAVADPDTLMQYIDSAISITEFVQATRHLSLLYGSPSSSAGYSVKRCNDESSIISPFPSQRKISRFKSAPPLPQEYINSLLKHNSQGEATSTSRLSNVMVAQEYASMEADGGLLQISKEDLPEEKDVERSAKEHVSDARAADGAYRAACCALSEGNAEHALSLLQVALAKCPPDKPNALGKVHRLMGAAWQLVEKNSAVLRSLPVERDL